MADRRQSERLGRIERLTQSIAEGVSRGLSYARARAEAMAQEGVDNRSRRAVDEAEQQVRSARQRAGRQAAWATRREAARRREEALQREQVEGEGRGLGAPDVLDTRQAQSLNLRLRRIEVHYRDPSTGEGRSLPVYIPMPNGMSRAWVAARVAVALSGYATDSTKYDAMNSLMEAILSGTMIMESGYRFAD